MHNNHALRGNGRLAVIVAFTLVAGLAMSGPQQGTDTTPATDNGNRPPVGTDVAAYRLGPEDLIEVFVWNEEDLTKEVSVRPDGRISLPLVNEVMASGRTAEEIQQEITARLRDYLEDPVVSVLVMEINSAKISVLGEVRDANRFLLRQRTTVLDAIAMAGGFTEYANRGDVVVVRQNGLTTSWIRVNVNDLVRGGNSAQLLVLQANDTVFVR
ncbi:MAG TPA: polysaccharide biosynthesis/export family protein [Acidobacteriota bacterium]